MANQIIIDIGAVANDGTGDPLRTAFNYVNNNFSNIWVTGVANSNIAFSGNKILTTNTNGNLVLAPNGIGKVQANVDIVPNANNTLSLGSLTKKWNTVYAQNLDVGGNVSFNDLTVNGNLTVEGDTIQIGNIVTDTKTIQLANTASTANAANGSGITVGANDNIATMLYSSTSNTWVMNIGANITGNVTAPYFIGNGSQLTGITSYANANAVAYGQAGWGGNIIPSGNAVYSLGNATNQWNDLYVSNATIYMNNVPLSLTAGNVLTVNGADVVTTAANGESSIGNLNILGTVIEIAAGAPETQINISPDPEGWAYLQLPTNATANSANTRLHNDAGNVEIGTGDFSTGSSSYEWIFTNTGNLAIPGTIVADSTVRIDNRESGITADIQLYAADDILLQAGDRTLGDDAEGGDINIYAGDGAPDDAGSGNTGGGDIEIIGGRGGAAGNAVSGDNGGSVRLDAGQGGDGSANAAGGSGATAYLSAGSGGVDNGGGGGDGGDVVITAGDTTDVAQDRGSVILNAGGGGDETSLGGYVQVSIPSVGANPGGDWTFTGSGTTLETPANAEIFGPNFGNLTVGSAGNTIITSADYGFTTYNWVFDNAGGIVAPNLTVTRGDRTGTLTGSTLRIGNGSQEAILTTPNGVDGSDSQRLVINPGAGSEFGEGGDIYLYSGQGGASGGTGGDIKIRGGLGPADGAGGYIDIVGGEAAGNGAGGRIDILGGQSSNSTGGDVQIYGGQGTTGGDANITGGLSTAGPGGSVNITGGTSSNGLAEYGNVTITSGASTWTFDNTGNVNLPTNGSINFNAGGITQATDEDFVITVNDADDDGFAIFNRITDEDGNIVAQTEMQRDRFEITVDAQGAAYNWQFSDNEGILYLPGNVQGNYGASTSFYATDNGSGGSMEMKTVSYIGDTLGSNIRVTQNNATISTGNAAYTWTFDNTGNLTVPGNTIVSTANATSGSAGKSITIRAGAADQSDYYTTAGGNVNIVGGLGATNDGGGGGQGGSINITSGASADPAGVAGNVTINSGTSTWTFDNTGNIQGNISLTGTSITINNAGGGNEGAEIAWALPAAANTTLTTSVVQDVYQNSMRFFEGGGINRGLVMDIGNAPAGTTAAVGYRDIPQITLSANVTANATNAGRHFYSTTAGNVSITLPDNANVAFPLGATLTVVVNAAGNVLVNQGTGVNLYMAGSSTTGNRAVGAYGLASVMKIATDTWVISGTGVY